MGTPVERPFDHRLFSADGRCVATGTRDAVVQLAGTYGLAGWSVYVVHSTGALGAMVASDHMQRCTP